MNDAYIQELEKLAAKEPVKPRIPAAAKFSPRWWAGLGTAAAAAYGVGKLGQIMKPPELQKRKAAAYRMEKRAGRRPRGINPVFNLRGREKMRLRGKSLEALLAEAQRRRPNSLRKDKLLGR